MEWLKTILTNNKIEEAQINTILENVKKEVPKYFVPKEDFNSKIKEVEGLNAQVSTLTGDIESLKKIDPTKLQEEITKLQEAQKEVDKTHKEELKKERFNNALELAIANSKTIDSVALKAHLKLENLKLDEEKKELVGFNEQIESLKESKKYLFEGENQGEGDPHGTLPPDDKETNLTSALTEKFKIN